MPRTAYEPVFVYCLLLDITRELCEAPLHLVAEDDIPRIDTQAIFIENMLIVTILLENLSHSSDSIDRPISHQECLRELNHLNRLHFPDPGFFEFVVIELLERLLLPFIVDTKLATEFV